MTNLLQELEFVPLCERRKHQRLTFLYKLVNDKVPAMPSQDFITFNRPKRAKAFEDYIDENIVRRRTTNNDISLSIPDSTTPEYRASFFIRTIIDWNHFTTPVVHAPSVEAFKDALAQQSRTISTSGVTC